jgi:SAM-dependent methyltransferase
VYDSGDYYADDGSRLSPAFDCLLRILDGWRARVVAKKTGLSTGRVLDVGAGDGKFLHFMRRLGFEVQGTTTSRRSASAAHARFGLSLDISDNLNHLLQAAPFDLVTYWHVYEHLQDPRGHAKQWPDLIRAGGFIIIEVPNARSIGARLCRAAWLGADEKHHVNHQAPDLVLTTVREAGFEAVRVEQFSGKYSYPYLWSALLGRLFGRRYDFDGVMGILKTPLRMVRARPLWTINAIASIGYLAPAVLALMLYGQMTHQGEVLRIYARRRSADTWSKVGTQ